MMKALCHLVVFFYLFQTICRACPVKYRGSGKPLLFGGVAQPGRCASGCYRASSYWDQACQFKHGTTWGSCSEQQAAKILGIAGGLGRGQPLQLSPCDLLPYLKGRTLWLLGDSHTKSFYRALKCFVLDLWDNKQECEASTDAKAVAELQKLPVQKGDSQCIHLRDQDGGRICIVHVVLGSLLVDNKEVAYGGVLPLLRAKFARPEDIFYINFSIWHKKRPQWWEEFEPALHALGRYYQATKSQWPHLLFRETPARHGTPKTGNTCRAASGLTYQISTGNVVVNPMARIDSQLMWSVGMTENSMMRDILGKYDIPVVPAFNVSVALSDTHVGKVMSPEIDCLHYCSPGLPELWIWSLFRALRSSGVKPIARTGGNGVQQESNRARFRCIKSYTAGFQD